MVIDRLTDHAPSRGAAAARGARTEPRAPSDTDPPARERHREPPDARKPSMTFGHPSALPAFETDELVNVVVETPSGSRQKYNYDHATGLYRWGLELPEGMRFPLSFGFVPNTLAADGDPLDVVLLLDGAVPTGTVVTARPVGVMKARQTEGGETTRNDRLIAAAEYSRTFEGIHDLGDLRRGFMEEVETFFAAYNDVMGRAFEPTGRADRAEAFSLLHEAVRAAGDR